MVVKKSDTIKNLEKVKSVEHVIICFPFAGGGASAYQSWVVNSPANIAFCPVQLPGRENRIIEEPLTSMEEVKKSILNDLIGIFDSNENISFWGHSMGAKIAYELAAELQESGHCVKNLFVSACPCPGDFPKRTISNLSDDDFIIELNRFNGTPKEILEDREVLDFFLPMLRADFGIVEKYADTRGIRLNCPIVGFCGDDDSISSPAELLKWEQYTNASFSYHVFKGDHFFIKNYEKDIIDILTRK